MSTGTGREGPAPNLEILQSFFYWKIPIKICIISAQNTGFYQRIQTLVRIKWYSTKFNYDQILASFYIFLADHGLKAVIKIDSIRKSVD